MSPKDPTKDDKPTICGVFTDVNETLSGEVISAIPVIPVISVTI